MTGVGRVCVCVCATARTILWSDPQHGALSWLRAGMETSGGAAVLAAGLHRPLLVIYSLKLTVIWAVWRGGDVSCPD